MSKVDLDKLMCSLTKVDIVGTYLASCFQDALREQGLVCDDGKIKNINNKPDETEEPIEIKEGNYYKCNHAYNYFSLGSIYYSPKDGFLMDDYGHGIDITDKASYFEFAYTIDENPTESKEDEEVKEPTNKIKKGGVYKCLCNCMNRNFINKGVYVSEEDNHLIEFFRDNENFDFVGSSSDGDRVIKDVKRHLSIILRNIKPEDNLLSEGLISK